MNNITYRTARPADADRINELFIEMLNTIYSVSDAKGYEPGYTDKFFSGGDDRVFIAECDGQVIAFLSVEVYRADNCVYLDDFSVTEAFRGRGIGTMLIASAEACAKENGVTRSVLHVEKTNEAARRFYLRHGYIENADEGQRVRMMKEIL